jgi:peptidoglycan hydrolase-like protein with peptidoglycan-binding domain
MIDAPYSGQVVRHDSFSQSATVGPMDFYGYSDPASMAVVPAPVPVAQTADVKLRVLQEGMSGIDVSRVQNILKFLGIASLTADGIFGPATKEGVERYQRMLELTQDGIVGKETWANLLAAPNQ